MLSITALALTALTSLAHAEMKAPGTFVPSLCSKSDKTGARVQIIAVEDVCVGRIEGQSGQALSLKINDGSSRVYVIESQGKLGGMGVSKKSFSGNLIGGSEDQTIEGALGMTSGITTTYGISLQSSDNLEFKGNLWPVYTTL